MPRGPLASSSLLVAAVALLGPARPAPGEEGPPGPLPLEALGLPAETTMIVGIDVPRVRASAAYAKLAAAHPDGPDQLLDELEQKRAINIRRDVDQIVFGLFKPATGRELGLALFLGRFDREAMARFLGAQTDLTQQEHLGSTLYLPRSGGSSEPAIVILDQRLLAVGDLEAVKGFLGGRARSAQPLRSNATLVGLLGRVRPGSAVWLVGDQPFAAQIPKDIGGVGSPDMPALKAVAFAVQLDADPTVQATLEAADSSAAATVADILRKGLSTLALKAEQELAQKELASAFGVTTEAPRVRVEVRIPGSLLDRLLDDSRPKPSGEAVAIGDLRTVISAEAAYQQKAGGYGELRCLGEPGSCLPKYPPDGPRFLDKGLASLEDKAGYRRKFYLSRSSDAFAYTAVPTLPGKSGTRGFCGDASGLICVTSDGQEPRVVDGRCPADCQPLR